MLPVFTALLLTDLITAKMYLVETQPQLGHAQTLHAKLHPSSRELGLDSVQSKEVGSDYMFGAHPEPYTLPSSPIPEITCDCPVCCFVPVCGEDGKTYRSECQATCNNKTTVRCGGNCPCETAGCACPKIFDPVCGEDGKTYSNACEATCKDKTTVRCGGNCPCDCPGKSCDITCDCPPGLSWISDPVCGVDGKTYNNVCEATCADKTTVRCRGNCPCETAGCACSKIFAPVCGRDGKTYDNVCEATCNSKTTVLCRGNCPCETPGCACPKIFDPVCGEDGKTYSNACEATCKDKTTLRCGGNCPCETAGCACPKIFDPVCGEDGKTYSNACEATCKDKTSVRCRGNCPCETPNWGKIWYP